MKTELHKLLGLAEEEARTIIFKEKASVMPTWILSDGTMVHKVCTPWKDEFERSVAKVFLRMEIKGFKTVAYSFISEVWLASGYSKVQTRDRPDKQEAIFALATDGKSITHRAWNINRNWEDQVIKLELRSLERADGFGGWVGSLLGEPTEFI
jgi:hypothetical protein